MLVFNIRKFGGNVRIFAETIDHNFDSSISKNTALEPILIIMC